MQVSYVSKNKDDSPLPDLRAFCVDKSLLNILKEIRQADWVVLCGGTHFHDDYKLLRLIWHVRYMCALTGAFALAKLLGKRVAWISMGFGPFRTFVVRALFQLSLHFVDFISVRDTQSLREVKKFSSKAQIIYAFDLSGCLLNNLSGALSLSAKQLPLLGISPTLLHLGERRVGMCSYKFWEAIAEEVAEAAQEHKFLVRVFEFRGGQRESDKDLVRLFINKLRTLNIEVEHFPYESNPLKTLRAVHECKWFVASRFHSAVFAYLAQVPQIIIPYHRKLIDFAHDVGLNNAVIPLEKNVWRSVFREKLIRLIREPYNFEARNSISWALSSAMRNFDFIYQEYV
jgi:polysaccharide pyruvyl transferase WcaK-like protein